MQPYFKSIMLLAVFILCTMPAVDADAAVTLVQDGKSSAVIVVDDNATGNAKYAARELQTYLEKISGVTLPISNTPVKDVNIFVGEGAATRAAGLSTKGLKYDGFRIVTKGDKAIYLFGRDYKGKSPLVDDKQPFQAIHIYNKKLDICAFGEAGTLYAVYHFLREFFGVRWFMPGELGEVVPKRKTISVNDMNMEKSPDFYYRMLYIGLFDRNDEGVLWYRRAGFGAPFPVRINHSFYLMQKYYPAHPEYFALLKNGKRDHNTTCLKNGNLCLSNPGLFRQYVDDICRYFDTHPNQLVYAVVPNDHLDEICQCPECQAQADYDKPRNGRYSNYVWGFVNRVAKEVAKRHPDKLVGCIAYSQWRLLPDRVKKLEPNVAVMFCKSTAYHYSDVGRIRNDVLCPQWSKMTKNFFTWDYYCWDMDNPHLTGLPIFFSKWLDTEIKKLKGKSHGAFIEAEKRYDFPYPEMNHLNIYLTGKLMWDADADINALLDDYYEKFYGPAAPEMKKFWTYAETLWTNMKVKDRSAKADLYKTLYTPAALQKLKSYLEAAQKAVKSGSVYAKRIAKIQNHFYPYVDKISITQNRPNYIVKRIAEQPVVDGRSDDAIWQKANVFNFVRQTDAKFPAAATSARMLHDDNNLYILVEADEPAMNKLVANAKSNDSLGAPYIWEDDALEIFIAPDRKHLDSYAQIIMNTNGVFLDGWFGLPKHYAKSYEFDWNSNATCRIGKTPAGWCMEIAIPLASLSVDGEIDTQWAMNLCRDRTADIKERSSWAPTLSDNWHTPSRFGFVTLEK